MSHRIATKTKITDKAIAKKAIAKNAWEFRENGDTLTLQTGPMRGATINCRTGEITGDTDYHDQTKLQALSQDYGEAMVMDTLQNQGGYLLERSVLPDGRIRLIAQVG